MFTAFDILFILIALTVMLRGFSRRWSAWRRGREEDRAKDWSGLLRYLVGHEKILENRKNGITHLMIFWGLFIPLLIIIVAQFNFSIPPVPARVLSLFTDILGIFLLAGTLYFLIKKVRSHDTRGPKRSILPMCILLLILITGFLAEGSRLSIISRGYGWASPFGWLLSFGLPASPLFMQWMIRAHFFAVLLLVALLPFTFFRHIISSPLNVLFRRKDNPGELKRIPLDKGVIGVETYRDFTWKQLLDAEACVSCGRCEENCPAFISGKPLSPRKVIQDILAQMESRSSLPFMDSQITQDEIWSCTTCMACVEHCPVFVDPMDKVLDMRRSRTMGKGIPPAETRSLIRNLEIYGDVQGKGIAHRSDWAFNRDVPLYYSEGLDPEILLWVGCSGAFHPRYLEVTRAMVFILKTAGIPFGILGKDELCCGDPARRLGDERLFLELARKNIARFKHYNVKKLVTLCPHCLNTLKNEYPSVERKSGQGGGMMNREVVHASEYVMELMDRKLLFPKYPVNKRVAIHDPCYLGRGNRVYEPPRKIIESLPEMRLIELKHHHEKGFCCGGGGGGMWIHEQSGRRVNVIRAEEVAESHTQLLGTACPYCLTMLDDGLKSLELEKTPEVRDIIEIVASSIG